NKVAYLEKGKGWEAYEQILDFLNRSHIQYALTHRPTIVFDSLVKQFWATGTVRTLEAGPSDIIATIDGNEVVVTESIIRTQLQLNDVNGLYEFTLHDFFDGMRAIGYPTDGSLTFYKAKLSPQWRLLIHTLIHCMSPKSEGWNQFPNSIASALIYPSLRPTFDFTAKLFSNMKLNWDGPHMPLLAYMLVVPATGDGADAVAASAAVAHERLPPSVPLTHSSSFILGPSSAPQSSHVGESSPVREPSPVRKPKPVRESRPVKELIPRPMREPTPDSPRPPSPPLRSEESTKAPQTLAATAASGAEDFAALTALSLKLDRCLNRVTSLENELGTTKKVLGEQDIDLEALYTLASMSLGGDSSDKAAGHDAAEVPAAATMPFRQRRLRKPFTTSASSHVPGNIPASADIPAAATIIPAGSSMDAAVHSAAAHSSFIPTATDKGKAPMVDDSFPADLLSEQERVLKNLHDSQLGEELSDQCRRELDAAQLIYTEADWVELLAKIATNSALSKQLLGDDVTEDNMNERLGMLHMRKRRELAEQSQVKPMTKTKQRDYMRDFVKNNSASVYNQGWTMKKVPASVPVAPTFAAAASVSAATTLETSQAHCQETGYPIVDMADAVLIKFDSDSGSDDDPLPYAPYAGWEMVPFPLGSVHTYHDMAGLTKHFTTLRALLHMVEKTDLQKLLGAVDNLYQREDPDKFAFLLWGDLHVLFQSLDDEDARDFWHNQDNWRIRSWLLYPRAQVYILETVDGWVIYMFVDVSYPLTVATLELMLKHGLEVPKLLVGGDLTMAEQLIGFIKSWLVQEQTALGKDKSNPLTVGSLLKTTWSSIHHLLTNGVLTSPEQSATDQMLLFYDPAGLLIPVGFWLLLFGWLLLVLFCSCCWNKYAILELTTEDLSRILKLMVSHSRLGKDYWELQISLSVVPTAIDKRLKTRRIMRSLERFIGGRIYEGDFMMLQRTI
nr:synaptobrevin, longin-like domain protein [Tanacetum cinerariifolium]